MKNDSTIPDTETAIPDAFISPEEYKGKVRKRKGRPARFHLSYGILCAVVLHAGIILFGGYLFISPNQDQGTLQQVELLSENDIAAEKEKKELEPEKSEELETEQPPDAEKIIRELEMTEPAKTPELEAASLSAIEAALSGQAGGSGDFADALSFASGGRIGGTGKSGVLNEGLENAFSLAEIDQKPRAMFQAAPSYPAEMRDKKIEGVVHVLFIVDPTGKVINPRVDKSTHPAFEKPAIDAVKQWKFEPAIKGGERVSCKMRVPIRFQPR